MTRRARPVAPADAGVAGTGVEALRKYYNEHALADSGATFSRFVSFALAAGPPPKFDFELRRDELPPDALALEGFNEVLANFYREAQIDQLWQFYQPDYEARRGELPRTCFGSGFSGHQLSA